MLISCHLQSSVIRVSSLPLKALFSSAANCKMPNLSTAPDPALSGLQMLFNNRYQLKDIPDLTGKTAIVTGGSAGIGASISALLASSGCKVHILSATKEHGVEAVEAITEAVAESTKSKSGSASHHTVDLGRLSEVQSFIEKMKGELEIKGDKGGLDYLVLNAGIGVAPWGLTKDGLGNHWQINYLSHMLLATSLIPTLEATSTAKSLPAGAVRIVMQSSELHRAMDSDAKFDSVEELSAERDPTVLYGRSKLMLIHLAKQLAKRKLSPDGNKVVAIAVHPGGVATDQEKGVAEAYNPTWLGQAFVAASRVFFKTPDQGAEAALWATTAPAVEQDPAKYQGVYLRQPDDSLGSESKQGQDQQLEDNLWEVSKKVLQNKVGADIPY